ncbi:MAG: glycosyltransferase family 39 protein [Candidatus Omnitrophota bacterium]
MQRAKKSSLPILLILSSTLLFWGLGTGSLTSWDEALYAQVSKEILASGNWVDLTLRGAPWSDKPPLYMWATVIAYKIFGVNEFSVRFFSAVCGIGNILVVYLLCVRLYSRRAAFCAGLLLLSTWHFFWSSRVGMLDSAFSLFIGLSLLFLKLGEQKNIYLAFLPVAFGAAFLTKGVGALLVIFIITAYLICTKQLKLLGCRSFMVGSVVALVVFGWWHYCVFSHYGNDFVKGYIDKNLFIRTTTAIEGHVGDVFTYFRVLPNKGRPWGAFAFLAVPFALWQVLARKEKEHLLPLIWLLGVFAVATAVKTKLHWYIVALYPASSILIAGAFSKLFRKFTVPVVIALTTAAFIYLAADKEIFNLDYTHDTKAIARDIRNALPKHTKIYSYNIFDPALYFYCSDIQTNIGDTEFIKLRSKKNSYFLFERKIFDDLNKDRFSVVAENSAFVAVRIR